MSGRHVMSPWNRLTGGQSLAHLFHPVYHKVRLGLPREGIDKFAVMQDDILSFKLLKSLIDLRILDGKIPDAVLGKDLAAARIELALRRLEYCAVLGYP